MRKFPNLISREELRELYSEQLLSSPQIAKRFSCSAGYIRNKLREHNIPIRTLQEALPLSNMPRYERNDFSGDINEKAYLIGLAKGDLHVKLENNTVVIHTNTTKPAMLKVVEESFYRYGPVWISRPAKNGALCIRCRLNKTFDFLLGLEDNVPQWILEENDCFAAFLAGYSDAEGSFCLCGGNGVFSIRSQDKTILHETREKLLELGILLRPPQIARKQGTTDIRGTISNKDIWAIWIHRKDALLRLFELAKPYIKHETKLQSIEIIKKNIAERNEKYQRLQGSKYDKLYLQEGIKL